MANLKREIYFQKERTGTYSKTISHLWGADEKIEVDTKAHSSEEWGMALTTMPSVPYPKMKELYKNDWKDENGDDEFVPDEPVFEAQELELGFTYSGEYGTATTQIRSFLNYLAYGGEFMMWIGGSDYGRKSCRYESYADDAQCFTQKVYENGKEKDLEMVKFKVTIKVNDPVTLVRPQYQNGAVKELTT